MKVSIIIPYDADRGYLKNAVKSCQDQHGFYLGVDYEVIRSKSGGSVGYNVNEGLKKAKGNYIKICAEDDLLLPHCLFHLYNAAIINKLDFVCADALNFDHSTGKIIETAKSVIPKTVADLAYKNTIHGGTILYRREAMGLWDEKLTTAEEYELSLRMAEAGCKFGYTPHLVYKYRVWMFNKSGMQNRTIETYDQRELICNPYYWSQKQIKI